MSKIENEKPDSSDYPSEEIIRELGKALEGEAGELPVLAKKVPYDIKKRVMQWPNAFRKIAAATTRPATGFLRRLMTGNA